VKGVLFLCSGNSCRSQMAEGFAHHLASGDVAVFSAGTEPVGLNPRAVQSMVEVGIDISQQRSKHLSEIPLGAVDTVVTLCGDAAERCPSVPTGTRRLHWTLPDPARAQGSEEQVQRAFRQVRDAIEARVRSLLGASPTERPSSRAS
jgi:arsenate reductase